MTNKRMYGFRIIVSVVIALLMIGNAKAQEGLGKKAVQGSWRVEVTFVPGPGALPPSQALHTFSNGGSFLESNNVFPPSQQTLGHGSWAHEGGNKFTMTFIKFLFDPQGQFVGTAKVTEKIKLDPNGNEYTGKGKFEIYDPAGTLIVTGEATTHATRIVAGTDE